MRPRTKFIAGAILVAGTVGFLMTSGIKETGVYFLTPSELASKIETDPTFYNVGVKMGARVVTGTIERDVASQTITFEGLAPDTFTDDVDVVVEGRLMADGTFHATSLLAKCGSRYESVPSA